MCVTRCLFNSNNLATPAALAERGMLSTECGSGFCISLPPNPDDIIAGYSSETRTNKAIETTPFYLCLCSLGYLCTQSFVNARQTCEYRFEQRIVRRRGYFLPLPSAASPYLSPSSNDLARLTPLVRGPLQENWSVHEILIYSHSKQPAASTPIRHIANQQQTRLLPSSWPLSTSGFCVSWYDCNRR